MNHTLARPLRSFLVFLLATQVWAQSAGPTFPDPGKTSMTKDEQQALRLEVAAQVYQQMPVLPDNSPESPYVRSLGQKLVATIPQQCTPGIEQLGPMRQHSCLQLLWKKNRMMRYEQQWSR